MAKRRNPSTGAVIVEYVLAVGLIGMALMGVMKELTHETEQVGRDFQIAAGTGQIQCDPMQNPNCP